MSHQQYMQRCLDLAILGAGNVSPNPMVGAVLVHKNEIIGEGYHQQYGQAHAEVNCIESVKPDHLHLIPQSILYVSLEPCSHIGKTPPCADLIIKYKIPTVVIACRDISSKVNGKGIAQMKAQGIEVIEHVLESEAIEINKRFFSTQSKSRPYIILKWAQSADGFISKKGESTKISNEIADKIVHKWRSEEDAIWIGYQTLKTDNPQLNVRKWKGKNPIRIVYDAQSEFDKSFYFFDGNQKSLYFNHHISENNSDYKLIKIDKLNPIPEILSYLHLHDINSVIIEGGAKMHQFFVDHNLWDEIRMIKSQINLSEGIHAAKLSPNATLQYVEQVHDNQIVVYKNSTPTL